MLYVMEWQDLGEILNHTWQAKYSLLSLQKRYTLTGGGGPDFDHDEFKRMLHVVLSAQAKLVLGSIDITALTWKELATQIKKVADLF